MREHTGLSDTEWRTSRDIKDQKDVPQHASLISAETRALPRAATIHCIARLVNIAIDELSNARMLADNQPEIVTQDESPRDRSGSVKRKFIRLSRGLLSIPGE